MKKYIVFIALAAATGVQGQSAPGERPGAGLPQQETTTTFGANTAFGQNSPLGVGAYESGIYSGQQGDLASWGGIHHDKGGSVVSFGKLDQKAVDETIEDLNVLALILGKHVQRLGADQPDYKLGIPLLVNGSSAIHASYVEGFGAMFSFHVPFPLVAPQAPSASNQPPQKDTEWDKAKLSLYGNENGSPGLFPQRLQAAPVAPAYNADLVTQLKRLTLDALKNGEHLRHLGDNEAIVVIITGAQVVPVNGEASRPTMMTIRIDKSAAQAAASAKAGTDQLETQATVHAYLGRNSDQTGNSGYTVLGATIGSASGSGF